MGDGVVPLLRHIFIQIFEVAVLGDVVGDGQPLRDLGEEGIDVHLVIQFGKVGHFSRRLQPRHDGGGVERGLLDLERVIGEHILFRLGDIAGKAGGERQHQADADDADAAGDGGDGGAPLFGQQVPARKAEGRPEGHARLIAALFRLLPALFAQRRGGLLVFGGGVALFRFKGVGIADDEAVVQLDDAGGIAAGKLRIVRDHDDQPLAGDLFDEFHDLHAGLGIERARGLVGEQNFGVVDQGAGDGDALHLPARELIGPFVEFLAQPHALERLGGAPFALFLRYARKGERQLDIAQHRLVRDEVVRLEHKADAVVAVGVPVAVFEVLGGDALDDEVAVRVVVQPADDVQKRGLAAARLAEDGHEFLSAEAEADAL